MNEKFWILCYIVEVSFKLSYFPAQYYMVLFVVWNMIGILLLDEGSMITFAIVLLRFAVLAVSGGTLLMTLNPRYAWLRIVGLLLAGLLLLVAYGFLDDRPYYADPNGRYVVIALCVPVVVGFLGVAWYAVRAHTVR